MEEVPLDVWPRRRMAVRRAASAHYRHAGMSLHSPVRPTWLCAGFAAQRPCRTRHAQLLAEFHGASASLGPFMGGYFVDAAQDLRDESAHVLYQRFMGWLREQPGRDGPRAG